MPTQEYAVNEFSSSTQPHFNLLRILGGWGNVNGPGLLMLRSMIAGVSAAAVLGLSAAMIGSTIWGTAALPFIVGSSLGFALGSTRWYVIATKEALLQLDNYPSLLRLHLIANFPWKPELGRKSVAWYTSDRFNSSWQMRSMLVVGWLTAQPALDDIRNGTEAGLVESYTRQGCVEVEQMGGTPEDE
ncbi:hypothetical protein CTA2_2886 [Colletotrichum tanaceti]|uniref:Uncharacterized protein n=1 Tax=Colletotrichum tanaceti TaxID=1306861 RepID=A0A4U6XG42_9PEZI|nr:hypothetical protein CTA2_2886 [Colletotrichum tanaceti]TKW54544.1 hypothetical protein CTA1_2258 [Colletotrichum tanaceti]